MEHIYFRPSEAPAWYVVGDFLCMKLDEIGLIIKEEPEIIRSWFAEPEQFQGNHLHFDNSPSRNALDKYTQLIIVAEHIKALNELVGCEKKVIVILNRPRKKLRGQSFADIARSAPNPLPEDNGFQDMIEKLQSWCERKAIQLPETLARV